MGRRDVPPRICVALAELKQALSRIYGERLRGVLLYGSYARGEYRNTSDVDVLVVLAGPVKPGAEISRMSPVVAEICLKHDLLISTLPVSTETLNQGPEGFFQQVRREAMPL